MVSTESKDMFCSGKGTAGWRKKEVNEWERERLEGAAAADDGCFLVVMSGRSRFNLRQEIAANEARLGVVN